MKFSSIFFLTLLVVGTGMQAIHDKKTDPSGREFKLIGRAAARIATAPRAGIDQLPLPASLQALGNVTIIHCRVTQQSGAQCGSRSIANALAIQEIIIAGEELAPANIRAHAARFDHILINNAIDDDMIAALARNNHLFNAHIFAKMPKEQLGAYEPYTMYSLDTQAYSLDELIATILTTQTTAAHLICNTGGHWVLVSIVKREGQKPTILYMDSCNAPLTDNSVATGMIHYLYKHCIG